MTQTPSCSPAGSRRRTLLGGALAVPAVAAAAACGAESGPPAPASSPVTISYHSGLPETHPTGAARLQLLEEFNRTSTQQITVDLSEGRATTSETKAKTLAAAGTPPHLFYVAYYSVTEFLVGGMTVDVDAELKGDKDWGRQRGDLFPSMLESSMWGGKVAGIPVDTNNQAMIYNTGLLQQAGVAAPKQGWTWDDFKATVQKFLRPDVVPLSMAWAGTWRHWLGTMGARIISRDSKKITADTPELLEVMQLYLDFLKRGIILKTPDGQGALFETYQLAKNDTVFEVQGPYRMPTLEQKGAPPYLTIHVPVHPQKKQLSAGNGGWNVVVFKDIPLDRRRAALQTGLWMNAPYAQTQFCIRSINIPVSKATLESKEFQDYARANPAFKGFADLAPYGWRWPALPSYAKINKVADDGVIAIMKEEIGAKAGLARIQQEAQTLLDEDLRLLPG
jgi:multiple sugar transport system substrate-binding protein